MPRWLDIPRNAVRRVAATLKQSERNTGRTSRRREPSTRPVASGVRIEYTPNIDGDPDPGEVVWTWVPFEEDPTLGKDRPVVIIGRHGDVLSGVALTSKPGHGHIEVGSGPWDDQGRPSYAKVDRLLDIAPETVRREGAVLGRRRFDAVIEAVDRLHDVSR
jgi:PemK-like, MazF-like toxin of type II toxin-antitoxin system